MTPTPVPSNGARPQRKPDLFDLVMAVIATVIVVFACGTAWCVVQALKGVCR